jgi:hypothetical protein
MTTKTIPSGAKGVFYGASTPAETIVNNSVVTNNPSSITTDSRYAALTIYEAAGITLVNTGTFNSSYVSGSGSESYGVLVFNVIASVTNAASGVMEVTSGLGDGLLIAGGTAVNYGHISGGPGSAGSPNYSAGIFMGNLGGIISNASSGVISGGGIVGSGLTTIVNAGQVQGVTGANAQYGAVYLEKGGLITNLSTGTITAENGSYGVRIKGAAGTVVNAGYITNGSKGGDAVTLAAGYTNMVVVDPGARFHGLVDGGAAAHSTLELGSGVSKGTLAGFNSEYINFGTLTFAPSAQWLFQTNSLNIPGVVNGFVQGDTIDITGFTATSITTLSGNKGVVLNNGASHATISFGGTISNFEFTTGSFGTDLTTICFCVDTLIGTPDGEVPVQALQPGDMVPTAPNGPRKVAWVGTGKVLATRGQRGVATPVIVRKGALADDVPNRDLHVTKAHSLYIDDVLIPVEFLVNHRTIVWDDRAQEVEIYHVELESHDVLIANGVPAESFRDDGNRWLFQNARSGCDLPPQEPYAPVLTGGPVVDAVWRRLLDRAGPRDLPTLTDDPDVHLLIDGVRVDAQERRPSLYVFRLPCRPTSVVLASRDAAPAELGIVRDPRSLGVALSRVTIRQGAKFMLFDADDERLTTGFHDYEPADRLRWTDGHAELPIDAFARFDQGAEVMLHLGGTTHYPDIREEDAGQVAA